MAAPFSPSTRGRWTFTLSPSECYACRNQLGESMATGNQVLYVYRCSSCGHRGWLHLDDDSHDGGAHDCDLCRAPVVLEWDGGVRLPVGKEQGGPHQ
jgi:hypothetical protein